MQTESYDVAVVGGSAAGLSAALVLGRARRRVVVIDAGAPRNAPAAHMHGFLSRDGMPPAELLATGRAELRSYDVDLVEDDVLEVDGAFTLRLASRRVLQARRVLLATGAVDELVQGSRTEIKAEKVAPEGVEAIRRLSPDTVAANGALTAFHEEEDALPGARGCEGTSGGRAQNF